MKTLVISLFIFSIFLGAYQGFLHHTIISGPHSGGFAMYVGILNMLYTVIDIGASFIIFYLVGRTIDLKSRLAETILILIVTIFLGMFSGYGIIAATINSILPLINAVVLLLINSIHQFFIVFTALALSHLTK